MAMELCRRCQKLQPLDTEHFEPTDRNLCGHFRTCRACRAKPMPQPTEQQLVRRQGRAEVVQARIDADIRERAAEIAVLIRRYVAVRDVPGPDRAAAYALLAEALRQHGRQVSDGTREWEWSRGLGEIQSRLIQRTWRKPEDPHGTPRRIAKDQLRRSLEDLLVEDVEDSLV